MSAHSIQSTAPRRRNKGTYIHAVFLYVSPVKIMVIYCSDDIFPQFNYGKNNNSDVENNNHITVDFNEPCHIFHGKLTCSFPDSSHTSPDVLDGQSLFM